jgi:hypothetical protein
VLKSALCATAAAVGKLLAATRRDRLAWSARLKLEPAQNRWKLKSPEAARPSGKCEDQTCSYFFLLGMPHALKAQAAGPLCFAIRPTLRGMRDELPADWIGIDWQRHAHALVFAPLQVHASCACCPSMRRTCACTVAAPTPTLWRATIEMRCSAQAPELRQLAVLRCSEASVHCAQPSGLLLHHATTPQLPFVAREPRAARARASPGRA